MTAARTPDAGFTLIETLVALAILAMSAAALLSATQTHVTRISGLEYRAAAQWATENLLAELTLGLTPSTLPPPMLGIGFDLDYTLAVTEDPDIQRVDIRATDVVDGQSYGLLTGFLLTDAQASTP